MTETRQAGWPGGGFGETCSFLAAKRQTALQTVLQTVLQEHEQEQKEEYSTVALAALAVCKVVQAPARIAP